MRIMITGATGLVGSALVPELQQHQLTLVGRDADKLQKRFPQYHTLDWQQLKQQGVALLAEYDVIIHLAGANIGSKRWSHKRKQEILSSRVDTTGWLAQSCAELGVRAPRLLCASAIGCYDIQQDLEAQQQTIYTEGSILPTRPKSFVAKVGAAWEQALTPAIQAGVNVVMMRFAVVLSRHGGALKKMLPSFQLGAGAVLGSGEQPFSWVSMTDLLRAIVFILEHKELTGPINIVTPHWLTQKVFAETLASVLHRPCLLTMPGVVAKCLFGAMADELLLNGQTVLPDRLQQAGFEFAYLDLTLALEHMLQR